MVVSRPLWKTLAVAMALLAGPVAVLTALGRIGPHAPEFVAGMTVIEVVVLLVALIYIDRRTPAAPFSLGRALRSLGLLLLAVVLVLALTVAVRQVV